MHVCLARAPPEDNRSGTGSERVEGRSEVYRQRRVSKVNEGAAGLVRRHPADEDIGSGPHDRRHHPTSTVG